MTPPASAPGSADWPDLLKAIRPWDGPMPTPEDAKTIAVNEDGRWTVTLEGRTLETGYDNLDEAVDAVLAEESLACARIPADRTRKYRDLMEAARQKNDSIHYAKYRLVVQELEAVALEICKRVKQEAVETKA